MTKLHPIEMRITIGVILVSGVCGRFLGGYSLPVHQIISRDISDTFDETYNSIVSVSENKKDDYKNSLDIMQVYLNKLRNYNHPSVHFTNKPKVEERTYLLVKTRRQRDKRYISYLTLCHFKICNMGRKRTTRYFHVISKLNDNDS